MKTIPGYTLQEMLYDGSRSLVYRARRDGDGAPVIVKLMQEEHPSGAQLASFRREHEILAGLDVEGVVRCLALERYKNRLALVMEDFGGRPLSRYLAEKKRDLGELLEIAIQLTRALGEIHRRHIIHKDINPANIVINPETGRVKIIDFGISTVLSREAPAPLAATVLEGTLAYISPEQTGRMNRAIDYRTDFYSLGVTLYEMLTGAVPFAATDALELVHLHIAKEPSPARAARPDLPEPVSRIVSKLLSKTAEERYRSAHGLEADLAECLAQWRATGTVEHLVVGAHDLSDRFQLPQKLYGREAEIGVLLATFDRAAQGRAELMLVAGYSGIGKSAVVSEIHKPVVRRRGYFISGKFDQLQRDAPYASLIEAFQDLVRQLLAESEERLADWRRRLLDSLGENARVITDVIPELGLILGEVARVPALPPAESLNRFNFAFQRLVRSLAADGHPLVMFLDDLQWADAPSLKLVQLLVTDPDTRHLLVIGAYRDNEVTGAHPLTLAIDAIRKAGAQVTTMLLLPLDAGHVEELVDDTLRCGLERGAPLARLALEKTGGNPFFLGQFLRALHEEKLLEFDPARLAWRWDDEQLRGRSITDNVVELMAAKIQRLPEETQHFLRLAACIGNHFDLRTLAIVAERPPLETGLALWRAVEEGLILAVHDAYQAAQPLAGGWPSVEEMPDVSYRFLHDRVQQAAYSLIEEGSRAAIHLEIGRQLHATIPAGALAGKIFDVVNQFDLGVDLITSREERYDVARLNLLAGRKAKSSAAYEPARRYLRAGVRLLPEESWRERHELAFDLHAEAMEAEYLNADLERARELSDLTLARAETALEKAKVYEIRMLFHTARNEIHETIDTALTALNLLNVPMPPAASVDVKRMGEALAATQALLAGRRALDLLELPVMTDPMKIAAMRIMATAGAPMYITYPMAFPVLVCEMVNLALTHGNSGHVCYGYGCYGVLCSGILGDVEGGNEYGELAFRLVDRLDARDVKSKTYVVVSIFIRHWKVHNREILEPLLDAFRSAVDCGDIEFAGYALDHYCKDIFYVADPLDFVDQELRRYLELMTRHKQEFTRLYLSVVHQTARNLMGAAADPRRLSGESFDEERQLPVLHQTNNTTSLSLFYVCRATLRYLFGDFEGAKADTDAADPHMGGVLGMNVVVLHNFYRSLALLALLAPERDASPADREAYLATVEQNQALMKRWAENGPANYLHKYKLVEAERARVLGHTDEAMAAYDEAIHGAAHGGFTQEEALASERCAELHLAAGRDKIGEMYLGEARYGYLRWGATAKVADLDRRYPRRLGRQAPAARRPTGSFTISTTAGGGGALDLTTVMKAARAISGEIELESLLSMLMRSVAENAGAEWGFVLVEQDGALRIDAEWEVGQASATARPSAVLEGDRRLSTAILNYVVRTKESVILGDASAEGVFTADPYVVRTGARSVMCAPLVNQGKLIAVIYLENSLTAGAFTAERLEVLELLLAQAALSIHNARLYASLKASNEQLEHRVEERTSELRDRNDELAGTLAQLRATQKQLVMQEKLASLGALTAGIAHEIKNPLNFVTNFADLSGELVGEISDDLGAQRARIDATAMGNIDDALGALRQNVGKIGEHGRRANDIVNAMLLHSRHASGARGPADLNALVTESVSLAYQGTQTTDPGFALVLDADYDRAVGEVELVSSDISRVFINLINNACYALRQKQKKLGPAHTPTLTVRTRSLGDRVTVSIRDNGTGILPDVAAQIYNPFFTTKPPGEGTGLGLSISHEIVVLGHGGELRMETRAGEFTEFTVTLPRRSAKSETSAAASDA